ncbi:MAG TPA: hypothetical protein VNE41_04020 [Chitinophagaceae bacterium]|nr:hypothetical protein [Chitinophagaceae bacterium]
MKLLIIGMMVIFSWGPGGKNNATNHKAIKIDSSKLEQCHYRYPDGTRCKEWVWKPAKFCPRHRGA